MVDDQKTDLGSAGEILRRNIRRIRDEKRLTFVALAERLAGIGRPIAVLGLRRIERGERRIDVDDLLALAGALGVTPVDLLVPNTLADDEPYSVTPTVTATAGEVRDWIGGLGLLTPPNGAADVAEALRWMPDARATAITRRYIVPMSDAWVREDNRRRLAGESED